MAQIKITLTIEAELMRDAHAAVDAADATLRKSGGRVVRARLTPALSALKADGRPEKFDWTRTEPAPRTVWVVLYSRIPTAYAQQQKMLVEAATAADAREIARDNLGDRGKEFATYHIEDVKPFVPLAVEGRVIGGAL